MRRFKVRDATEGIPKGLILIIDRLEQGGVVRAIGVPDYKFEIDKAIDHGDYFQIASSNAIANIEEIK